MTLYEFLSKMTHDRCKVIHTPKFDKCELMFEGFTDDFLANFKSTHKVSRTNYFNCYIANNVLVVCFEYNREVRNDTKEL